MLPLAIQTSHSSAPSFIPIQNFKLIYELAKASKCNTFIVYRGKLYGSLEEGAVIHEIEIPFPINTDLAFSTASIDREVMNSYDSFFIPSEYNWILLPTRYWENYKNGDLELNYNADNGLNQLVDKASLLPIDQVHILYHVFVYNYGIMHLIDQVEKMIQSYDTFDKPVLFNGMEDHAMIRKAYDNKVDIGRVLIHLQQGPVNVAFYFYKGMFGLNKADKLSIEIRMSKLDNRLFMATFAPEKKKKIEALAAPLHEIIRCMYVNLI